MKDKQQLTNNQGVPITDNQNSLTVGEHGPVLLQDINLIEKLAHFDRERIPERVVHAKGAGAHGYFQVNQSMAEFTCAKFLQEPNKKTPVFARFSTVVGARGSADTVRDPRGFAVKFYTEEGNYDLVGNHLPVFFIRDPMKFPDMVHAFKPAPDTNIPTSSSANSRFWDFISLTPESTHMITWLFSDRGTIKSYRKLYVQIMEIEELEEKSRKFDPLDPTKIWPEDEYYLMSVGRMVLNRNPENYFAEVEQAAFSPSSIVPGIELSADKLLLGRGFSYSDTQRYRLGINYLQLPINRPLAPVNNNQRDGAMQYAPYDGGTVNYEPNTLPGGVYEDSMVETPAVYHIEGDIIRKKISITNDYNQAGEHYRSLNKKDQDHLVDNITDSLGRAEKQIQTRMLDHFNKADPELGNRVENGIAILNWSKIYPI